MDLTTQKLDPVVSARDLQSRGLRLIKLGQGSKIPLKDEMWREPGYGETYVPEDFSQCNIGVRCGDPLPGGGYLVILDIDPRNGGMDAWKYFAQEHDLDEVPQTLTVETGGSGLHFYFRSEKPLQKFKLQSGIDVQGAGSYCVAPGSLHESGRQYWIRMDDEIAALPEAIKDLAPVERPLFDGMIGHFSEVDKVIEGGRNAYLTQVAGALRRSGLSHEAIFYALKQTNAEKCNPSLSDKEVTQIAKSVSRYAPESLEVSQIPLKEKKPERDSTLKLGLALKKTEKDFLKIYETADGLIKSIADQILTHSDRRYPHLGIASGCAVISAASQGAYRTPSLGDGKTSGGLSAYFWVVAPSAAGKEAYRSGVETYCRAIDDRLVFDRFGSCYGLRSSLFCHNSGISVIDEFQDEMERLGGKQSSSYLQQVLTEMKELSNDLKELKPVVLSKTRYPGVKMPRYSIFGVGTVEGFQRHLSSSLIGGGLLSRFSVWPVLEVPSREFQDRLTEIPREHQKALRDLYAMGLTDDGARQDPLDELKRFFSIDKDPNVEHRLQHNPSFDLKMEPKAKLMLHDYYFSQEEKYKRYLKMQLAGSDVSPGSVADRAPRFALKCASWHALGCQRAVVTESDMTWGMLTASTLADWLCEMVTENAGSSQMDKACAKIMSILNEAGEKLTRTQIHHKASRHISAFDMQKALETLVSCSEVEVFAPGTDEALECDGVLPKARGLTYSVSKTMLETP